MSAQKHHAIVANPPYIVGPSNATNKLYRERYASAHKRFGLGAPFTERMFELLVDGGFVAQITSNAFMKREYGKPLVEEVLPHYDLQLVVDTSGAFIAGHGTPTVILAAQNRAPTRDTVRCILGRRGEPARPTDHVGRVWSSILRALGAPPEDASSGAQPIGLVWSSLFARTAKELARVVRDRAKVDEDTACSIAAGWITGAAGLVAFNARRARYEGSALPDNEHLGRSFERVAEELPDGDWWNPDTGVNPCWRFTLDDAWSGRIRAEVARVVKLEEIPAEQRGRTDWIGDLYQGLDDVARDGRALCQTPWFVAKLLAWLSVDPALRAFGDGATVLDPSCGTGHLLCEAFTRLYMRRADPEDGAPEHTYPTCARMALDQVHGIEIDPAAAALCRWRLMLAYLDASMPRHLGLVPDDLPLHITVADTLLVDRAPGRIDHAKRWPKVDLGETPASNDTTHARREQLSLFGRALG